MPLILNDLRESNDFLNILFENIPALVLVADKDFHIHEINDAYQTLFGMTRDDALGIRCGNALNCAFAVTQEKQCGETTECGRCQIRCIATATMREKVPADRRKLVHPFFIRGERQVRHFEFSTRYVTFHGQEMVLIILYDVTVIELQKQELESKQEKLDEALRAAGLIQHSLLPKHLPERERVEFAWKFKPCDDIGGDILNVVPLDTTHIGLYMLDVAGHGPPSAMISVLVWQLMNPHTGILADRAESPPRILSPEAVLDILDREFPLMRFGRHFTMVYAALDLASGELTYSNAAHCAPVVISRGGGLRDLTVSGTVIGIGAFPFGQETVRLEPGDKAVLYSDGVTEMQNEAGEFFGDERLRRTLRGLRDAAPDALVQGLYEELTGFAGVCPAADDVSILAFEYKG